MKKIDSFDLPAYVYATAAVLIAVAVAYLIVDQQKIFPTKIKDEQKPS